MASSTRIKNFGGELCTPSDEAGEISDDANAPNSGTTLASNFRKIRLQGHSSPQRDDRNADTKEFTPRSPNGTVLAKVQMFEAQNAKTISSPSRKATASGKIMNESKPVNSNKYMTNHSNAANVTESRPLGNSSHYRTKSASMVHDINNSYERSNRIRPSTSPVMMSVGGGTISEREIIGSQYIISNPTPEEHLSSSIERENLSVSQTVERAVDKAIAESRAISEKRRMGMNGNATEKQYYGFSRTTYYSKNSPSPSKESSTSSFAQIDPLDREARKKQDGDSVQITNSSSRKKKFQMVEASMKKNLRKDKNARSVVTDSSSSVSVSSLNSIGTDHSGEPGAISPKSLFGVEKKNADAMKFDELDVLPTIHSTDDVMSPGKDFVLSPISFSNRRDQSRQDTAIYSDINPINVITSQEPFRRREFDPSSIPFHSVESALEVKRRSPTHREVFQTCVPPQVHAAATDSSKISSKHSVFVSSPRQSYYSGPLAVDAALSSSFNDDNDDDTQFNSVSMQDNHKKGAPNESLSHQPSNTHYSPSASKGRDAGSYFFGGNFRAFGEEFPEEAFSRNDASNLKQPDNRDQHLYGRDVYQDDDAESLTDSVTNGSWTGRMRARKAMEQTMSSDKVEQRMNPMLTPTYNNKDVFDNHDDNISVANKVFNNVQKQKRAAINDAQEGFNIFSTEDPKSTAIGLGVAGALCGAIVLGPMGMVLGAAGAGVGYKFSQMPEKERSEVKNKASSAMKKLHVSAMAANDTLSSSCASACSDPQTDNVDTGVANNPAHFQNRRSFPVPSAIVDRTSIISPKSDDNPLGMKLKVSNVHVKPQDIVPSPTEQNTIQPYRARQMKRMTPACRRVGRITPVGQIHSLDPALHPRAWLDVMASEWTSRDEKNEAMEEILLLAKDKSHSRMLLDEGILDSLMFILRAFFLSYADIQRKSGEKSIPVETYMADPNFYHAKLASNCCVALAKAHCAMAHTNREDMIASSAHMTIPLTKQVAQTLYDVPHHMVLNTEKDGESQEIFKLTTEMSIEQAEDLASSIVNLSMGKIDVCLQEM